MVIRDPIAMSEKHFLYDLKADAMEAVDLSDEQPSARSSLRQELNPFIDAALDQERSLAKTDANRILTSWSIWDFSMAEHRRIDVARRAWRSGLARRCPALLTFRDRLAKPKLPNDMARGNSGHSKTWLRTELVKSLRQ